MELIKTITNILGVVVLWVIISLLLAYPTMLLWNWIVVSVLGIACPVTWFEMFGLMLLINLLIPHDINFK